MGSRNKEESLKNQMVMIPTEETRITQMPKLWGKFKFKIYNI